MSQILQTAIMSESPIYLTTDTTTKPHNACANLDRKNDV